MIEVENLTKQFGSKHAVDDLSFTVKKGEVLGFLGPNGAGKSTTMRMITGFIPPTRGDAKVCGISVIDNPQEAKTKVGYLPEAAPLYHDMTVTGYLKFCASIRGIKGAANKAAVERAIETCFLNSVARQSIDTLSKGYRHRTCLAQALLHKRGGGSGIAVVQDFQVTAAGGRKIVRAHGHLGAFHQPPHLGADRCRQADSAVGRSARSRGHLRRCRFRGRQRRGS